MLKLPFGLKIIWSGKNKWNGKQGRSEISNDELSDRWYAFQPIETEPHHQRIENKMARGGMDWMTSKSWVVRVMLYGFGMLVGDRSLGVVQYSIEGC